MSEEPPPTRFIRLPVTPNEPPAVQEAAPLGASPPGARAARSAAPPRPTPGSTPFGGFGVSPATRQLRLQGAARGKFAILLVLAAILVIAFGVAGLAAFLLLA